MCNVLPVNSLKTINPLKLVGISQLLGAFSPRSFDSTSITVLHQQKLAAIIKLCRSFYFPFSCFLIGYLLLNVSTRKRISHTRWSFVNGNYTSQVTLKSSRCVNCSKKFLTVLACDRWCQCTFFSALKCFLYVSILRGWAWKTTANNGSLNIKWSELDVVFYLCTRPKLVRRPALSGLMINVILF